MHNYLSPGHYLKIAIRHLIKNKVYAIINIGGLALGIAAFLLILQFVSRAIYVCADLHSIYNAIPETPQNRSAFRHNIFLACKFVSANAVAYICDSEVSHFNWHRQIIWIHLRLTPQRVQYRLLKYQSFFIKYSMTIYYNRYI